MEDGSLGDALFWMSCCAASANSTQFLAAAVILALLCCSRRVFESPSALAACRSATPMAALIRSAGFADSGTFPREDSQSWGSCVALHAFCTGSGASGFSAAAAALSRRIKQRSLWPAMASFWACFRRSMVLGF
eukprot:TRINITY_DN1289_c0_g1_i1.p3 TRINITY_DN1289_c0_g1~~TRINITY_DN1289_c0_g1_i1.p3  ORF type:complete len:134 (+),score=9.20 TRINITY_DN1289_c0_g1_i1:1656-2057(+)